MEKQKIGMFEAKTHFSQLIDKVERGERFLITRRGKVVAEMEPPYLAEEHEKKEMPMTRSEAVDAMLELRKCYRGRPGDDDIMDLINEGRKY
jgi:antitoxin (DNA-binding transcriptional repressor) of toxin-antitoxin stability system